MRWNFYKINFYAKEKTLYSITTVIYTIIEIFCSSFQDPSYTNGFSIFLGFSNSFVNQRSPAIEWPIIVFSFSREIYLSKEKSVDLSRGTLLTRWQEKGKSIDEVFCRYLF